MAVSATQSLSIEDNLYQEERETVKWQNVYGFCVETLPMITGHTSHFAVY